MLYFFFNLLIVNQLYLNTCSLTNSEQLENSPKIIYKVRKTKKSHLQKLTITVRICFFLKAKGFSSLRWRIPASTSSEIIKYKNNKLKIKNICTETESCGSAVR